MKRLITQKEAAEFFGISPKTLWLWTNSGLIPYIKFPGTRIKYDLSDLEKLIQDHRHPKTLKTQKSTFI